MIDQSSRALKRFQPVICLHASGEYTLLNQAVGALTDRWGAW